MKFLTAAFGFVFCLFAATQVSAQGYREDPEKVLTDEFGWTIKDITKLSNDKGGLFSARKEPYQGFNCLKNGRYLPKTDEQKAAWRTAGNVCRTYDRRKGENVGAYLELSWANLSVDKPDTVQSLIDLRGKEMAGDSAKDGYGYKIVETHDVDNIQVDLIEYSLPFSSQPFYGAAASFEHRGFRYVLISANAVNSDAITKKPWEVIDNIAKRIVFSNGP